MEQAPSIGRIVHHRDTEGRTSAAVVTSVGNATTVNLTVFPDGIMPHLVRGAKLVDPSAADAGWHWPPRV